MVSFVFNVEEHPERWSSPMEKPCMENQPPLKWHYTSLHQSKVTRLNEMSSKANLINHKVSVSCLLILKQNLTRTVP